MKSLFLSMLCVLLLPQCTVFDNQLSLPLMPYNGEQLRMDGYYYQVGYDENTVFSPCFFYKNGILISLGGIENSLEELDEALKTSYYNTHSYKKDVLAWGIFFIEDSVIKFERWGSTVLQSPLIREGVILNDTTFHITNIYNNDGSEQRKVNEIYHFREFSPKPDSTNVFIK